MNRDRQIRVMGIVNLTDDSYFASSRCDGVDSALARVGHMVELFRYTPLIPDLFLKGPMFRWLW